MKAPLPLHYQLRSNLERAIREGRYSAGDMLPAEPELMRRFNVSRGTVRKAYDALVAAGLVTRKSGRGSFVSEELGPPASTMRFALVVHSTKIFEKRHNPTNWELSVDKLNGVIEGAASFGATIELVPYAPGLIRSCDHDGFVLLGAFSQLVDELEESGRHYVVVSESSETAGSRSVSFNLETCFQEALSFLFDQGFERVAFIGTQDTIRYGNYVRELQKRNLEMSDVLFEAASVGTPEDGYAAAGRLLRRVRDIDAIFCTTDLRAMGVLECLAEKGIDVPNDVSVMGFDNIRTSASITPALTTYETPRRLCGKRAVEKLVEQLENPMIDQSSVHENGRLIIRDSVRTR